jgi:hypothetical protein
VRRRYGGSDICNTRAVLGPDDAAGLTAGTAERAYSATAFRRMTSWRNRASAQRPRRRPMFTRQPFTPQSASRLRWLQAAA